jgi:hypothetical protein
MAVSNYGCTFLLRPRDVFEGTALLNFLLDRYTNERSSPTMNVRFSSVLRKLTNAELNLEEGPDTVANLIGSPVGATGACPL